MLSEKYQTRLRHQIVQKLDLSNTMDLTYHTMIQMLDLSNKLKESFHSAGTDREILFTTIVLPRLLWPQPQQKCVQFKMDSWNSIKTISHFDLCFFSSRKHEYDTYSYRAPQTPLASSTAKVRAINNEFLELINILFIFILIIHSQIL